MSMIHTYTRASIPILVLARILIIIAFTSSRRCNCTIITLAARRIPTHLGIVLNYKLYLSNPSPIRS